jgi:hypothetical protein
MSEDAMPPAAQAEVVAPPGFEDAIAWVARINTGEPPHRHVSFTVADRDNTEFTVSQFTPPSG